MARVRALAAVAADPDRFPPILVRDAEDCAIAHVAGAVHIVLAELGNRVGEISPGNIAVTSCDKCGGRLAEGAARNPAEIPLI
jgi:rhodanese-related sulfurtransferase